MTLAVHLQVEVVGCPTICRHCWAQGVPYAAMPTADVAWVLEQAAHFFAAAGVPVSAFPMHEVAAHPDAARVLTLFQGAMGNEADRLFEPLSTTGVPFAMRPDWREVLDTCRALGTTTVFLAVHGTVEVHDRVVHRAGAYQETLLAAERVRSAGLTVGANVFLTKANIGQFDTVVEDLRRRGVTQFSFEPPTYYPTGRGRRSEALRPELDDLRPVAERARDLSPFHRDQWANLEASTEAAFVQRALSGTWPASPRQADESLNLICRPNLDVYSGLAGRYRQRYGNLRNAGTATVLHNALTDGAHSYDTLWFTLDPIPDVQELAGYFGDATGQRIHFSADSLRFRWLDLAQQASVRVPNTS